MKRKIYLTSNLSKTANFFFVYNQVPAMADGIDVALGDESNTRLMLLRDTTLAIRIIKNERR